MQELCQTVGKEARTNHSAPAVINVNNTCNKLRNAKLILQVQRIDLTTLCAISLNGQQKLKLNKINVLLLAAY